MYQMMLMKWLRGNRRLSREQKAREELKWRRVIEEIEMEEEGVSPIIDSFGAYTFDGVASWTQVRASVCRFVVLDIVDTITCTLRVSASPLNSVWCTRRCYSSMTNV